MTDILNLNNSTKKTNPIYRIKSFKYIDNYIYKALHRKYFLSNLFYGKCVINNIVYNEQTLIVAKFKDFLIMDDSSEFLKRYYTKEESLFRLPKFFLYYITYNKIFPNYTSLPESKYIYKNIHRKQKMIDLQQETQSLDEFKKEVSNDKNETKNHHQRKKNMQNKVFDSGIYDSIIRQSQDLYLILFGIEKANEDKDTSITSLKNIICEIDKYDYETKIEYNDRNSCKNNKKITTLSKIGNTSTSLTKQSTFASSRIAKHTIRKITKKGENNNFIALKKVYNYGKNPLFSNNSVFTTGRLIYSKSKSKSKNKNEVLSNKLKSSLNNITLKKINNNNEKNVNRQQLQKIRVNLNSVNCKTNSSTLESKLGQHVLKMESLAHKIVESSNNLSNKEIAKVIKMNEKPKTSTSNPKNIRHSKFNSFMSSKRNSQINKITNIKNGINLTTKEISLFSNTYRDLKLANNNKSSASKYTHKKFNTNIYDINESGEEKKLRCSLLLKRMKNQLEKNSLSKMVKVNKKEVYIKDIKNTINCNTLENNENLTERAYLTRPNKNIAILDKENLTTAKKNFVFHKKTARNDFSLRSKEKKKIIKNLLFPEKNGVVNNTSIKKGENEKIKIDKNDTKKLTRINKTKVLQIININ